jgi:hypothetical protein
MLALPLHAPVAPAQSDLRSVGQGGDVHRLTVAALGELDANSGLVSVVPGRLDQQSADVPVAGAGDRAAVLMGAAAEFNFQWAWSSGTVAGRAAGEKAVAEVPEAS